MTKILLTIITFTFIISSIGKTKRGNTPQYALPLALMLFGFYVVTIIPMTYMLGLFLSLTALGISVVMFLWIKKKKSKAIEKKPLLVICMILGLVSGYAQFVNGLETFYTNPQRYFEYAGQISTRYFIAPPKILHIRNGDYVYSITQPINSFFVPESMTKIEMYQGEACYYYASWKFGKVPTYYRRKFKDNSFIDSPA